MRCQAGHSLCCPADGLLLSRWMLCNALAVVAAYLDPDIRRWQVRRLAGDFMRPVGFERLDLVHSVLKLASCRVASRAGYEMEGTKRRSGLHADDWHDMHLHALAGASIA